MSEPAQNGQAESPNRLVVEYDKTTGYRWNIAGAIPPDSLIGMLEIIQSVLVDMEKMRMAQAMQQAAQSGGVVASRNHGSPSGGW